MPTCRVCGGGFAAGPALALANVPKAAQFLPDERSLARERGVSLTARQCRACGLVQLTDAPVPYYKDVIRATGVSEEMTAFRQRQFGSFVKAYGLAGKKVIEIGCGRGEYLEIMQGAGVRAYGLENDRRSVRACVERKLDVRRGFVSGERCRLRYAPFDAFFILNFLEHIPEARELLLGIANNLRPGAVGLVEVPNFDMIQKNQLFAEFTRDHVFYFTRHSLGSLLGISGFQVLACREIRDDYIISMVVQKIGAAATAGAAASLARMKRDVNAYVSSLRKRGKEVAIWGAGHQAFTVLSLCGLAGKIKYVVDSAEFKQGKCTPATHIPIVPPSALDDDPVDAVIVMAGSYSGEVLKTLRERYRQVVHPSVFAGNRITESGRKYEEQRQKRAVRPPGRR